MSFTSKDFRAIKYLLETTGARPLLTIYPEVRIQIKATAEIVTRHIEAVVKDYEDHRAEQRKEKARQAAEKRRELKAESREYHAL